MINDIDVTSMQIIKFIFKTSFPSKKLAIGIASNLPKVNVDQKTLAAKAAF